MLRPVSGVLAGLLITAAAYAQPPQLYRYIDDKGVTVLGNRVPAQFISRGYEVLDSSGRVKEVIAAAPTPAELQAHREANEAQARQRHADTTLLRLYSNQADLDRAQARQLAQIDNLIESTRGEIGAVQEQREALHQRAAVQERAGHPIDAQILQDLAHTDEETQRLQRLIEIKQMEIRQVRTHFVDQRARLGYLLGANENER